MFFIYLFYHFLLECYRFGSCLPYKTEKPNFPHWESNFETSTPLQPRFHMQVSFIIEMILAEWKLYLFRS